jgi:hypothetical protein
MSSVRRFHNVYTKEDFLNIHEIVKEGNWSLHHRFGKYPLAHAQKSLENNDFFTVELCAKIKKLLGFSESVVLRRVYMNYYFPGMTGGWHIDSEESNFYTFTTYVTDIPQEELDTYGGNLDIKTEKDGVIMSFQPETNSGVLFPANLVHRGQGSTKISRNCRIVLTWKFTIM